MRDPYPKFTKEDLNKIYDYLDQIKFNVELSDKNYILPVLEFGSCDENEVEFNPERNSYHTHIRSIELQDRSKFKPLFNPFFGIASVKIHKYYDEYYIEKHFYLGYPHGLSENIEKILEIADKIGFSSTETNKLKKEHFFDLETTLKMAMNLAKYILNNKYINEFDSRKFKTNEKNCDYPNLKHSFYDNIIIDFFDQKINAPDSLFYKGSVISPNPIVKKDLKEDNLSEEILRFHDFFDKLKI